MIPDEECENNKTGRSRRLMCLKQNYRRNSTRIETDRTVYQNVFLNAKIKQNELVNNEILCRAWWLGHTCKYFLMLCCFV